MQKDQQANQGNVQLEGGTYEILRNRLIQSGEALRESLQLLNSNRKEVFGSIETKLLTTERVTTDNNCVAWDMMPVGDTFIFGYNVHLGLRSDVQTADVFSVYNYTNHEFHKVEADFLKDVRFLEDFQNLYRYYKNTQFVKFALIGTHLYMVFRIGKSVNDIKAFKWLYEEDKLHYLDARSEHEFKFPQQHSFEWRRTTRDQHVEGISPHISIEDTVFVECINGDLTIKVENNTNVGKGIYSEPVDHKDQTLDDAEIHYALVGNIVVLKVKPYQEKSYRYLVYNSKIQEARRIDAVSNCCILLPDDHGLIFPNGYYLQTGEFKLFDIQLNDMLFEKKINSPNGEDYLYVFFNKEEGLYLLLSYNLIEQTVATPITCHGYSIFENGELCYFKADDEPKKHHALQIWQTPFLGNNVEIQSSNKDSILYKIGNKDIVRAMAECTEILNLIQKDDSYSNLYLDVLKRSTDVLDSYYWLTEKDAGSLTAPLQEIKKAASSAIDEFEKVRELKISAKEKSAELEEKVNQLLLKLKRETPKNVLEFVFFLGEFRTIRGELISLKDVRYIDVETLDVLEKSLITKTDELSQACVNFLQKKEALLPYEEKVAKIQESIDHLNKVIDANKTDELITQTSQELEMLIEIVSNLKIEDATQTTAIIDNISTIYSSFNQIKQLLKNKKKDLQLIEGKSEFNAQLKLINQSIINYLDVCDSPEKCEEYLSKLMVQLEELEGKFSEFDEYVDQLSIKREEVYNAFESKKVQLIEARNKRATSLMNSAQRILKAADSRVSSLKTINEINGYFASDLMIEKARNLIAELIALGDSVKADDVQNRLKTVQEDAVRQLKDKSELFADGENIIQFGKHKFLVNNQKLGLSIVQKEDGLYYHLTGTGFFEKIQNEKINQGEEFWNQSLLSENKEVYRAEYLAYMFFEELRFHDRLPELEKKTQAEVKDLIVKFMATRFNEGYTKGVHDHDASLIVVELVKFYLNADLLFYNNRERACARVFWQYFISQEEKELLNTQLKSAGILLKVFPKTKEFEGIENYLEGMIRDFCDATKLFDVALAKKSASYLFKEIARGDNFLMSHESKVHLEKFNLFLKTNKFQDEFKSSLERLKSSPAQRYKLILSWLDSFEKRDENIELAAFLLEGQVEIKNTILVDKQKEIEGVLGSHSIVQEQKYQLDCNRFLEKLGLYHTETVFGFHEFQKLKANLAKNFEAELRLSEFKPKVMSSFVRNQLIDKVYFPLIGANLAKQIGSAGAEKRTDLMGMLLLISPPGYGKTTLMEYLANRLGIIFMKINGPAIGHQVTSVDPAEAPNATAREELEKLNLSFEMGDNVMIYLDDIQHCNPEFLQKFISLCDAQRKIEGVYKGKSKTYDFRGKKVCVVMAGNPYTESGDKFQIPDMLANRADIYNLGDVLGSSDEAFKLSYIENTLTSNSVLARLAQKSHKDVLTLIKSIETGNQEGIDFEANHSPLEISEYTNVLKKVLKVRDTVLAVNQEYIRSAGQADDYRTEPPFKLQGSYRNMNKMVEKIMPVMNDNELVVLINSHYQQEVQTLTTGSEANFLKFKELTKQLTDEEHARWKSIKDSFVKNNKMKSMGGNEMAAVLVQLETLGSGLSGIKDVLSLRKEQVTSNNIESQPSVTNELLVPFQEISSLNNQLIGVLKQLENNQLNIVQELSRQQQFDMNQVKQEALLELRKELDKRSREELIAKSKASHLNDLERLRRLVNVTVASKQFVKEEDVSYIMFEFAIENLSSADLTFVMGTLEFLNDLDEVIHSIGLEYEEEIIAGKSVLYKAQIVYNKMLDKDVILNDSPLSALNINWLPISVK